MSVLISGFYIYICEILPSCPSVSIGKFLAVIYRITHLFLKNSIKRTVELEKWPEGTGV